ncbi:MAG: rhomboid family intramembrane serine protease [Deltaproteobacteria bacterium]|nr:rhomboid family intramembrane serine protease [Deltaproteobacteria bacterium]
MQRNQSLGGVIRQIFVVMAGFLGLLWGIEILDVAIFRGGLDSFGVEPRSASGLLGVLAAPFLHGGWGHLIGNTVGILTLGGLTLAIGRREFLAVTAAGIVVGGLGTWVFGRPAIHIGASGLVFAYFGYLLLRGWYDRRFGSLALAGVVAVVWGGMVFGMIPGMTATVVSVETHLFGFIGGALMARLLHKRR